MRHLIALLALCWSMGAWGANYYVKCDAGSNGAGTFEDPKNTFDGITVATGDNIYLWPDVVCAASKAMTADHMVDTGNNSDNVTISLYPNATEECDETTGVGCAKLDGGGTLNIGIQARNSDNLLVQDVWAHDYLYHNFRHMGDENSGHTVTLRRVRFSEAGPTDDADNTYSLLSKGTCGIFLRSAFGPPKTTVNGYDVAVDRCARLGMDHRWHIGAVYQTYSGSRTGWDRLVGGHGISSHPLTQDWTSGWTYESGTCPGSDCVYSHAVQSTLDDPQLLWDQTVSPSEKIQRVADGDTTPAQGYFSRVSDTLYVNFGRAPGSNTVTVIRQPNYVDVYDGKFWGNFLRDDGNIEGSGFHADNTSPMRCFRCASWDNEGNGFFFNNPSEYWDGRKAGCFSCIAWNNGSDYCTGTTCGKGIYVAGEADIVNSAASGSLRENIGIAGKFNTCGLLYNSAGVSGRWGLRFQHDAETKCTPVDVVTYGNSTDDCEGSAACTEVDPKFIGGTNPTAAAGFKLSPDSPLIRAGTCYLATGCVHYDYENKRARVPPDIGAFQRN